MRLRDGRVFGTECNSEKVGCDEDFEMDCESCGYLGESFGGLKACYHLKMSQILITTEVTC